MNLKLIRQEADYETSMKILKENGLRPLTYQEALQNSKELIKLADGKWMWFWLDGKGINTSSLDTGTNIFGWNLEGNLILPKTQNVNKLVRVWSGSQPLSLGVNSDDDAWDYGRRLALDADVDPSNAAPVVLGIASSSTKLKHKHKFVCECGKVKK